MAKADGAPTSRRAERRAIQHDVGRAQLLDAAEEIFGRKGFHETTLKEVAELAEFSVGSLYAFFEGKDELFRQIFVRRGDEFMPALAELLADPDDDPRTQLHAVVDFEVGFFRRHPHFGRLYLRYASATAPSSEREVDAVVLERYQEAMAQQAELIRRGQAAGTFHGGDAEVLSRIFSGLMAAFQAMDPAVATGDPHAAERLGLAELHAIIDRTFVVATGSTP